jgi:glutamyl-tRNA reductase
MKPLPNESYEHWSERVEMFERGKALQRLAQGEPVETVMEEMSKRIIDKLLHPIFKAIRESNDINYDSEKLKESYKLQMEKRGPVADHVVDDLPIDKDSEII